MIGRLTRGVKVALTIVLALLVAMTMMAFPNTTAHAQPDEHGRAITLDLLHNAAVNDNGQQDLAVGNTFLYRINAACGFLSDPTVPECVGPGDIRISGAPVEGRWTWPSADSLPGHITGIREEVTGTSRDLIISLDEIGTEGATLSLELGYRPLKYVTHPDTTWSLEAAWTRTEGAAPVADAGPIHSIVRVAADAYVRKGVRVGDLLREEATKYTDEEIEWEASFGPGRYTYSTELGPTQVVFTDTLPEGLEFLGASEGDRISTSHVDNVDISYDPATRTVTAVATFIDPVLINPNRPYAEYSTSSRYFAATVKYRTRPLSTGVYTNNARTVTTFLDNTSLTRTDTATVTVIDRPTEPIGDFRKTVGTHLNHNASRVQKKADAYAGLPLGALNVIDGPEELTVRAPAVYDLEVKETNRVTTYPLTLTLTDNLPCLDRKDGAIYEGAPYDAGTSPCQNPAFHPLTVVTDPVEGQEQSVTAVLTDGSEVELTPQPATGQQRNLRGRIIFPVPVQHHENVAAIKVNGVQSSGDGTGNVLRADVYGYADASLLEGEVLRNRMHGHITTGTRHTSGVTDPADIRIVNPVRMRTGHRWAPSNYSSGTNTYTMDWSDNIWVDYINGYYAGRFPDQGLTQVLVLPEDAELRERPEQLTVTVETFRSNLTDGGNYREEGDRVQVVVTPEYFTTDEGRQALKYTVPAESLTSFFDAEGQYWGAVLVKSDKDLPVFFPYPGVYEDSNSYLLTASQDPVGVLAPFNHYQYTVEPDTSDIDDNAVTNWRARDTARVALQAPLSAASTTIHKAVKGDQDPAFLRHPAVATVTPGADIDYLVEWRNVANTAAKDVVIYDMLPRVGDTGTMSAAIARESEFTPTLLNVGPVEGLRGGDVSQARIAYTTSENPCRPELGITAQCEDGTWTETAPADLAQVTGIRVTLTDAELTIGQGLRIPVSMRATSNDLAKIAWNNVASQANPAEGAAYLPVEAPKVGARQALPENITVTKVWQTPSGEPLDTNDVPEEITVELRGVVEGTTSTVPAPDPQVALNGDNDWTHTWEGLPSLDPATGADIVWTVHELTELDDFEMTVTETVTDTAVLRETRFTVTNTSAGGDPAVEIVKYINDRDANTLVTAPRIDDETMDVRFDITNTGDVALTNVRVTDTIIRGHDDAEAFNRLLATTTFLREDGEPFANGEIVLEPGQSATATITVAAPEANTRHTDEATVTGTYPRTGEEVTDTDPANAYVIRVDHPIPHTGGIGVWVGIGAGAGALLAAAVLLLRRRM